MHLEIEILGKKEKYSFPNNKIIKIGRSPECEIQILEDGISRVHAEISYTHGEFFYTDLGSTNGSFINEEPLSANEKTSFNTFFPIKLGFHVYLSLLDEVNIPVSEVKAKLNEEPKKIVKDKTNPSIPKNNSPKKNQKEKTSFFPFIVIIFMFGSYFLWKKSSFLDEKGPAPQVKEEALVSDKDKILPEPKNIEPPKPDGEVLYALGQDKCLGDKEAPFCKLFREDREFHHPEGFYFFSGTLYFVIEIEEVLKIDFLKSLKESDKNRLITVAKKEFKENFSYEKFTTEDRYKIYDFDEAYLAKASAFYSVLKKDYLELLEKSEGIENFVLMASMKGEYKMSIPLSKESYRELLLEKKHLEEGFKLYFISGLDSLVEFYLPASFKK